MNTWSIRPAIEADRDAMSTLIADSARALSGDVYNAQQIEAAIEYVFGVDSELLADESYFVVQGDELLACGGWSRRRTLFGGDQFGARESGYLDPVTDPAKIRAFFVHPNHARKGIGRALITHCEAQAKQFGFSHIEMMATLPGVPLYAAAGYDVIAHDDHMTPSGVVVPFKQMRKAL